MIDAASPMVLGAFLVRFLEPWQVLVIGFVATVVAFNLRFEWLLTLAVITLALAEFHFDDYGEISYEIRQLSRLIRWFLFLAMALKGITIAVRGSGVPSRPHVIRSIAASILILALFTTLFSYDRHVTLASCLLLGLVFFCAFGVLWRVIDGPDRVVAVAHALYRAYWPLIVASMLVYIWRELPEHGFMTGHRFSGIFLNPNGLGVMAAVFFPLAMWETFRAKTNASRLFGIIIVLLTLFTIPATGSRSALVGLLVSGTVFLFHRYGVAFPIFVTVIVALIFGYVLTGAAIDTGSDVIEGFRPLRVGVDPENRLDKWRDAWGYITHDTQTLILGYGYGTSRIVPLGITYGTDVYMRGAGISGMDFHSSHLQTWMDLGIPGLILVEALLVAILVAGLRFFQAGKREDLPVVGVALFASLVVMIGDTVVHGWLFSPGSGLSFIFWCYTALVIRATQFLGIEAEQAESDRPRPLPTGV